MRPSGKLNMRIDISYLFAASLTVFLYLERLYPPVPADGKTAVNDDVLPDGTKIPAGVPLE